MNFQIRCLGEMLLNYTQMFFVHYGDFSPEEVRVAVARAKLENIPTTTGVIVYLPQKDEGETPYDAATRLNGLLADNY